MTIGTERRKKLILSDMKLKNKRLTRASYKSSCFHNDFKLSNINNIIIIEDYVISCCSAVCN